MKREATGRVLRALGIAGGLIGCASMAAMLPAAAGSLLGAVGLGASSGLAHALAPYAEPLFIVSAVLLVAGAITCSLLALTLATAGSGLLYASMWPLASGSMATMSSAHAEPAAFWSGLILVTSALAVTAWRRHSHTCHPLLGGDRGR